MIRNTQGAENILKKYEDQLRKVYTVPTDTVEVETYRTELKVTEMYWSHKILWATCSCYHKVFLLSVVYLQICLFSFTFAYWK